MDERELLAERFEAHRDHLRKVAYRMLGSLADAEDAVQEGWLHASRAGTAGIGNLGGWFTTVVARICLDMLRSRRSRAEQSLDARLPDPILGEADASDPEQEALLSDSVGLALLVVLDTLSPAERLAFVLHDMFAVPFDEIGPIMRRSPAAARQLASRARRRVQGATPAPDPDLARQRDVVDAFLAAARAGDFAALVRILDPDVVLRADSGAPGGLTTIRGAGAVGEGALAYAARARHARPVLVNGAAGLLAVERGRPVAVMSFTIRRGTIGEINILTDPRRLSGLCRAS